MRNITPVALIQWGGRGAALCRSFFFIFRQFSGKIGQNYRFTPHICRWHLLSKNPESATEWCVNKYWNLLWETCCGQVMFSVVSVCLCIGPHHTGNPPALIPPALVPTAPLVQEPIRHVQTCTYEADAVHILLECFLVIVRNSNSWIIEIVRIC